MDRLIVRAAPTGIAQILAYKVAMFPFQRRRRQPDGTMAPWPDMTDREVAQRLNDRIVTYKAETLRALGERQHLFHISRNFNYCVNCPPVFLDTFIKGKPDGFIRKPCKRFSLCPWCWVRDRSLPAFNALRRGVRRVLKQHPEVPEGHSILCAYRKTWKCVAVESAYYVLRTHFKSMALLPGDGPYLGVVLVGCVLPEVGKQGVRARVSGWLLSKPSPLQVSDYIADLLEGRVSAAKGIPSEKLLASTIERFARFPRMMLAPRAKGSDKPNPKRIDSILACLQEGRYARGFYAGGVAARENGSASTVQATDPAS